MADSASLPEGVGDAIAAGIAPSIEIAFSRRHRERVEIGESFEIWYLNTRIEHEGEALAERATFDGRYHHQIFVNGRPAGFAVSQSGPTPADWKVVQVVPSRLALLIDLAIDRIDREVPDPVPVVLLTAPAYLATALWVRDPANERLWVVAYPQFYERLVRDRLLSAMDFVGGLWHEQRRGHLTSSF